MEEISGGRLFIDDKVVNDLPPKDRDIAIVFQNYALYPHMTAYENLAFGLKNSVEKQVIHEKSWKPPASSTSNHCWARKPKAMRPADSANALPSVGPSSVTPKVFLFDEPLSNLDAKLCDRCASKLPASTKLKTTIVYVTHDQ
ncbi:MAG: hypothetical protein R2788_09830 [Saprospiraceae bacterium]